MLKKLQIILCMVVAMAFAMPNAHAQNPPVVAPKITSKNQSFYVFGKQGKVDYGKEDNLQVLFVQVPVSAGSVTLYVWDPASGGKGEPASNPAGSKVETAFTVYGGAGAYTGVGSQSVRPSVKQAGSVLSQKTFGTTEGKNSWYAFGPYNTNQGEVVGDVAIFKIVAEGLEGDGGNLFKIGSSVAGSEVFAYDVTLHLSENRKDSLDLYVEAPAGTTSVNVSNFDVDDAGVSTFAGKSVKEAGSGVWETTKVDVSAATASRLEYSIVRGGNTEYANAGFHFTDGNGAPLRMFFVPAVVAPAPAPAAQQVCDINTSLVSLRQAMPGEAYLNQELSYTITVTALQNVANVKVTDRLGENVTYGSSTPAATVTGSELTWNIGDMDAGASQIITVKVTPTKEGMVNSCAIISADPRCCVGTYVGQPILAIEKSGPEKAILGDTVTYTVKVTNNGTAIAKDVVVTDTVPEGMSSASGSKTLKFPIGNLAPKQSQVITVALKADARGNHCNVAEATSSNAGTVKDDACTLVQVRGLTVAKTGTKEQFSGKVANYDIVVKNTGDTELTNVVVVDTVPDRMRILKAEGATINGQTATWTIANLPAGEERAYKVDVTTPMAGELCNKVAVNSAEGLTANSEACTLWKGQAALLLEVIDTNDPILPGEETTYVIQITNQGTADDHDVMIVANFPVEISPISAAGSSTITVAGKTVTATAFPVLKPKQMIEWTIKAKGEQAGDSRLKVEMKSRLLQTPVHEEESTHVY